MAGLVATLRLEVVKPLDGDWAGLGRVLRALRTPAHRVLNRTVTELELDHARKLKVHPRTASYRLVRDVWKDERAVAAERIAKSKPYAGDEAVANIAPSSYVILGTSMAAFARWQKWSKDRWSGKSSLPTFKAGGPVFVQSQGVRFGAEDGIFLLGIKLDREWRRLVVRPYGGSGFADVRRIAADPKCISDLRLIEDDRGGKRKWMAMLAWTRPAPERREGRTMAVHRGVTTFLTVAVARSSPDARDAETRIVETGADVVAHKHGYTARRRSLGQQGRQIGDGAKGHGVERRHERITKLEDAEARWVQTKCRQIAARVVKLGLARGVGRLLLEDWTNPARDGAPELGEHVELLVRSFPLAQLRDAIEWAAKKVGWQVEFVPGEFNSRDCPMCGHRNEPGAGRWECAGCQLTRNREVIYVWNMLRRDGLGVPLVEATRAGKRAKVALIEGGTP